MAIIRRYSDYPDARNRYLDYDPLIIVYSKLCYNFFQESKPKSRRAQEFTRR
jgi:hypothetical protein